MLRSSNIHQTFECQLFRGSPRSAITLPSSPIVAEPPQHAPPFSQLLPILLLERKVMDKNNGRNIDFRSENGQHKVLNAVDHRRSRTSDSPNCSTHRSRSKSIGARDPSKFLDGPQPARSREPAAPPSILPGPGTNQRDAERNTINYLSTSVPTSLHPESPRRSRCHSRSRSQPATPLPDSNIPPVPDVPSRLGPRGKLFPVPSVVPPRISDLRWVTDDEGWPHRGRPEQYQSPHDSKFSLVGQQVHQQAHHGPLQPPVQFTAHPQGDSTRFSRSDGISDHHPSRRSRSHSRPRLEGSSRSPAPDLPLERVSHRKLPKIPSVLPPGYPDGAVWVREPNGRPRVETPEQYRKRYGLQSPAIPPRRQDVPKHVAFRPEAQWFPVQEPLLEPEYPSMSGSPAPQKPLLKRIFGGIVGRSKNSNVAETAQLPTVDALMPSPSSSRTKERSRTNSF
ncbi:hypothetical protein DL96DRAFT_1561805 [Flagelloscypha sp. PMI_526]|nr:hypothetical protein DL96DRAFT_1561805 [Flagelloscypha sp. PMI_526]